MNYEQTNSIKELTAPVNRVLEELGWEPKVGDKVCRGPRNVMSCGYCSELAESSKTRP